MKPTPLLIVSDNPTLPTGLARQSRDIATLACTLPEYRVGYMGRGIGNCRKFPFTLYQYPEHEQWGERYIKDVWEDFSDGEHGIILTCDDLSRRHWFVRPDPSDPILSSFLGSLRSFERWAYVPLDGTGPNGTTLPIALQDCSLQYDRVLATSEWGCNVLKAGGRSDADWLPHGIFEDRFHPVVDAKEMLDWGGKVVVGCVMANQARKDYPTAFETFAQLRNHYGSKFKAWLHTDTLIRYWNVYALAADYGVGDCLGVTLGLNDSSLALHYSACDCTVLPSGGEGFGFPIAESLACGTPAVVTDYAAGPSLVTGSGRVPPARYRVDTQHNILRAVNDSSGFAERVILQADHKQGDRDQVIRECVDSVAHLGWSNLQHPWKKWLLEGV